MALSLRGGCMTKLCHRPKRTSSRGHALRRGTGTGRLGIVPSSSVFPRTERLRTAAFMIRRCSGFLPKKSALWPGSTCNMRKNNTFLTLSRIERTPARCRTLDDYLQICNERHKKISYRHGLFQKCYFFLTFRDNFLSFKKNQHHLHHGVFFYVQNQNRHRGLRQSRPRR